MQQTITWTKSYVGDMIHQWDSDCGHYMIRETYPGEGSKKYNLFVWDRYYGEDSKLGDMKEAAEDHKRFN